MLNRIYTHKLKGFCFPLYTTLVTPPPTTALQKLPGFQQLCSLVSTPIGGLNELELSLEKCEVNITPSIVVEVVNHCKEEASTRRLLRFFTWSCKSLGSALGDKDYNHAIRVFAEKKDHRAVDILLADLRKDQRVLEAQTFGTVAEIFVKMGREDDALGIFKNLDLFKCPQDRITVTAIVNALCAKGHARRAEGVVYHHKDKISGAESCVYRSILYGWSVQGNVKETRRLLQEMKSKKITLDLYCFNTYLRCLCEHKLKKNPSGLVPEALNVFMEMKTYKIVPNSISYNVLLSCLGRTRRVKESLRIFDLMRKSGCAPDWATYYLIIRVLYLTGRFGKGNQILELMEEDGLEPPAKFYHDLVGVLCGVERVNYALELFGRMKKSSASDYGPVYDVLIPKFCKCGEFEKGKELWDEAERMGIALQCSRDVLDPSITEVFPPKKEHSLKVKDTSILNTRITKGKRPLQITKKPKFHNKRRQKKKKPKKKAAST
ncbi:pentatricopeptide repeat-containing protein At5g61370, mitochondrial-like [Chenopodium quinoa]|uniref:Pentatricopeptide repeat-containing protein n=1 Tax=Chenopodium quinoa TaxID=63459 RepID=A0A803L9C2_CHEQI|nr:pentatricopeptide repeat-containing protein At5g61370, mitochondrial-like [Chenopodium quinoa]